MDVQYKGHLIMASALHTEKGWLPILYVTQFKVKLTAKNPRFTKRHPTKEKAQQAAVAFAKKWIDDGKPPLRRGVDVV